ENSRCKQCGTSFRIPSPIAQSTLETDSRPDTTSVSRALDVPQSAGKSGDAAAALTAGIVASRAASESIVFNCPRCFKRYEVDAAMVGKKSRCKDCKEVFAIPAPAESPAPPARESAPVAKRAQLGARNFAVIPEEVISRPGFEEVAHFEEVKEVHRAP